MITDIMMIICMVIWDIEKTIETITEKIIEMTIETIGTMIIEETMTEEAEK